MESLLVRKPIFINKYESSSEWSLGTIDCTGKGGSLPKYLVTPGFFWGSSGFYLCLQWVFKENVSLWSIIMYGCKSCLCIIHNTHLLGYLDYSTLKTWFSLNYIFKLEGSSLSKWTGFSLNNYFQLEEWVSPIKVD